MALYCTHIVATEIAFFCAVYRVYANMYVCVCIFRLEHYFRMANSPHTLKHNEQMHGRWKKISIDILDIDSNEIEWMGKRPKATKKNVLQQQLKRWTKMRKKREQTYRTKNIEFGRAFTLGADFIIAYYSRLQSLHHDAEHEEISSMWLGEMAYF